MQLEFIQLMATAAIAALWWWVQRPLTARKWVYAVTLGGVTAALCAALYLPHEWYELRYACMLQGILLLAVCLLMLPFEGQNEPRCRRRTRLAALPARSLPVATLPCALTAAEMVQAITARLHEPEPTGDGGVVADYGDERYLWELSLHPMAEGSWVLLLWSYSSFVLRDREAAAICAQHEQPLTPALIGRGASALALCRDGVLHIYPAEARDDVALVLQRLT